MILLSCLGQIGCCLLIANLGILLSLDGKMDDFGVGAGDAGCGQQLLLCPAAFL